MRIAYFTAGTVGAGHLVRGLAIGRGLMRRGFDGDYRMFGPPLAYGIAPPANHTAVAIEAKDARDPQRARTSDLARTLAEFRPDLLLVDMFWASLRHFLPSLGCEAWLLVRKCPGAWFVGPSDTPYAPEQYRRTIAIEPVRHLAITERIDPIVVCNPDECRPPTALRERLGMPPGETLTVVTHAGVAGEIDGIAPAVGEKAVRCDLHDTEPLFPLAEWLGGADRIFSAAGYNSYWEARWLGYADRTHFAAQPRRIDDQAWRIAACGAHAMRANGADVLAADVVRG